MASVWRVASAGLFSGLLRTPDRRGAGRRPGKRPPVIAAERLEDRTLLTAYVVTTDADGILVDGLVSLREAIQAANTNTAVNEAAAGQGKDVTDTIRFAASLAGRTITLDGAELAVTGRLNITGLGADRLAVSGRNLSRVFTVSAALSVSDLTIKNGADAGSGGGGGFQLLTTALTLTRCVVSGNSTAGSGGGINAAASTTLQIRDCLISGNSAVGGGGGVRSAGALVMSDTTVSGNSAIGDGGGFRQVAGTLTLTRCVVSGNSTTTRPGGGIYSEVTLRIQDCLISGNSAGLVGGGIASISMLVMSNTTVSGNSTAGSGGGIFATSMSTLRNVTVVGNRADSDGNADGQGGGILLGAPQVAAHNTLVAGNRRGTGAGVVSDVSGTFQAGSFNLIGDAATAGGLVHGTNGNVVGVDVANVLDPVLGDNGGPTRTHKLIVGSLAIDAGSDAQVLSTAGVALGTDQRGVGFERVRQARVDIGAFEAAPAEDLIGYVNGAWFVGETTGTAFVTTRWAQWANVAWRALRHGDFNGDGRSDVLGLLGGEWFVGLSDGDAYATRLFGTWANVAWDHVSVEDFDGDGRDDVVAEFGGQWFGATTNAAGTAFNGPALRTTTADFAWDLAALADVTGDGKADLVLMLDGKWFLGTSNGAAFALAEAPNWANAAYQLLTLADVSGDGRADLVGFIAGEWYVGRSNGTTFLPPVLRARWANAAWADPLVGDFDGTGGTDDVAARLGGQWFVGLSNATGGQAGLSLFATWSNVAWRDVRVGDFDGDGRDDIAGRFNGEWYVGQSTGVALTTSFRARWAEVAWLAVAAADASGVPSRPGIVSGGGSQAAFATPVADDEPLVLFWKVIEEDETFAGSLLAGA